MPCVTLNTMSLVPELAWYRVGLKARFYWGWTPFSRAFQGMVFFHGNSGSHAHRYQASTVIIEPISAEPEQINAMSHFEIAILTPSRRRVCFCALQTVVR